MVNDLFDGTEGFAIDGGIKDSKLVCRGFHNEDSFVLTKSAISVTFAA